MSKMSYAREKAIINAEETAVNKPTLKEKFCRVAQTCPGFFYAGLANQSLVHDIEMPCCG